MKLKKELGLILVILGIFIIIVQPFSMTGAVIDISTTNSRVWFFIGLGAMIGGIGLFLQATLEQRTTQKLFFRDEKGKVRLNDFVGGFEQEGIPHRTTGKEVLNKLKQYSTDPESKRMFMEIVLPDYVEVAREQLKSLEGKKVEKNSEYDFVNQFLQAWDSEYKPLIHGDIVPISIDSDKKDLIKIRHYTTKSRASKIAKDYKFGGKDSVKPLVQGKIFVELAKDPVLSQQDFIKKYAITNKNIGETYIELLVSKEDISSETSSRTGDKEYFIKANDIERNKRVYNILSEIKTH